MKPQTNFEIQNLDQNKNSYKTLFFLSSGLFLITASVLATLLITQKSSKPTQTVQPDIEETEVIPTETTETETESITSTQTEVTLTPTKTTSNIPKDWKTYTDSTYKFSINYPSDWEIDSKVIERKILSLSSQEKINYIKTSKGNYGDDIHIFYINDYRKNETYGKTIEDYLSDKGNFSDYSKTNIGGLDGYRVTELSESGEQVGYYLISGDNLYIINSYIGDFSETEKQIINTIKFN